MSAHHRQHHADFAVGGTTLVEESPRLAAASDEVDVIITLDASPHQAGTYERFVKPLIDVVGAVVLLVVLSPILLTVAVGVRATLGKGVFYRQTRMGRNGQPFTMLKFRSMIHDRRDRHGRRRASDLSFIGEDRRRTHKHPEDPRVTAFGGFIRRYSLDELPQLINVLRGDLSLVGPRPELVEIVDKYEPWQHRRHDVKPGLTGLWQVTERDREGRMHLCVDTDLEYIRALSFTTDLRILAMTLPVVLGASEAEGAAEAA